MFMKMVVHNGMNQPKIMQPREDMRGDGVSAEKGKLLITKLKKRQRKTEILQQEEHQGRVFFRS